VVNKEFPDRGSIDGRIRFYVGCTVTVESIVDFSIEYTLGAGGRNMTIDWKDLPGFEIIPIRKPERYRWRTRKEKSQDDGNSMWNLPSTKKP
jgi:hypothetical protein